MQNRDIIITGLQSWDLNLGSNAKNIALEFSRHNRVLYIDPPVSRLSWLRNRTIRERQIELKKNNNIIKVGENIWVYYPKRFIETLNRLPFNPLFDWITRRNSNIFAKEILYAMQFLSFNNHIHFCDSDMFRSYNLKERLNPELYIYYSRDNLLGVDYWKRQGLRYEPKHMAKADIVLSNSEYLTDLARRHNPNSHFIGQGCDLSNFMPGRELNNSNDRDKFGSTVLGYVGSLNTLRLDIEIIDYIAVHKPNWQIVLVGPEDEEFRNSILHERPNVWFAGRKPVDELPGWINSFDVAINPQKKNEITIGNYPRKIDEYLAMGKPVVATDTPAMRYFSDFVSLAADLPGWISALENELVSDCSKQQQERISFAESHSWEKNVSRIYEIMETISI
jgi:teichuronic acid biosynthesis glycosyltransferase TuaH